MPDNKRILIADTDKKVISALKGALNAKTYDISIEDDGAMALQKAFSEAPGAVILSVDLPTIDGVTISRILRANPRTESIPFIFLSESDIHIPHFQRHKDHLFIKPVNADEIASVIYVLFSRVEKSKEVSRGGRVIEGSLTEISLSDLLQIFSMNRKEGMLFLSNNKDTGEVYIKDGEILEATIGNISGEKALYRLLTWGKGNFKFLPTRITVDRKINKPADNLIMEGLRQLDEWESLKDTFPLMDARVEVLVDLSTLPKGLRPITQEILFLMEFYPKVSDIIDRNSFPDYEVMRTVMTLLNKGIIGITRKKVQDVKPILQRDDVLKLKERLVLHKNYKLDAELGKVLIFSSDNSMIKNIINAMNSLPEFYMHQEFLKGMGAVPFLGTAGHLQIGDSIQINFIIAPLSDLFSPLWRPLSNSMLCGIAVLNGENERWDEIEKLYRHFHGNLHKPMAFIIPDGHVTEDKAREIKERLDLRGDIMLFPVMDKEIEAHSMLSKLLHSVIGDL